MQLFCYFLIISNFNLSACRTVLPWLATDKLGPNYNLRKIQNVTQPKSPQDNGPVITFTETQSVRILHHFRFDPRSSQPVDNASLIPPQWRRFYFLHPDAPKFSFTDTHTVQANFPPTFKFSNHLSPHYRERLTQFWSLNLSASPQFINTDPKHRRRTRNRKNSNSAHPAI